MFAWLIPCLVFLAVFLIVRIGQNDRLQRRLQARSLAMAGHEVTRLTQKTDGVFRRAITSRTDHGIIRCLKGLSVVGAFQVQWIPTAWDQTIRKRLARLPHWRDQPASTWLALKELSVGLVFLLGLGLGLPGWLTLGLSIAAFYLPELWLKDQEAIWHRRFMRALPDTLDLLAACMEAGLGFESSLGLMLERGRPGPLQEEFEELGRALRMGQPRADAFAALADRVAEPDFSNFVHTLLQAERLGVSVAATFKQQASQLRVKRSQRAEKLALEAPVKLLFPLIIFIFPVVFMVLFGPIIIRFLQGF